jgi:hypothetical protein
VAGPSWLAGAFAAVMILVACYCAARLLVSWLWQQETELDADGVHAVMGAAMAGMLVPRLSLLPGSVAQGCGPDGRQSGSAGATAPAGGGAHIPYRIWSSALQCSTCSWHCRAAGVKARVQDYPCPGWAAPAPPQGISPPSSSSLRCSSSATSSGPPTGSQP